VQRVWGQELSISAHKLTCKHFTTGTFEGAGEIEVESQEPHIQDIHIHIQNLIHILIQREAALVLKCNLAQPALSALQML